MCENRRAGDDCRVPQSEAEIDTIPLRLKSLAGSSPGKVFSTFLSGSGTETITFGELYLRSRRYADLLVRMGIRPGDVVIIILKHTPHLFYTFLGAMIAGAVPSFMPFPSAKQRSDVYWHTHEMLFRKIRPSLIITYGENEEDLRRLLPDCSIPVLIAGEACFRGNITPETDPAAAPDDVACLQHSSGTTSLKKGVILTHDIVIRQVGAYARSLDLGSADSIVSWLPLYHDMGLIACFLTSVSTGTHLVALDAFDWVVRPETLLDAIERYRTSFCWLPNFAFTHIVNLADEARVWDLSSMRAFINCSEPCKAVTFERFAHRFASCGVTADKLQVCYAMAENVFAVTQTALMRPVRTIAAEAEHFAKGEICRAVPTQPSIRMVSCGRPLDGIRAEIVDDSGILPDGKIGEIRIAGPYLFGGYYRQPELTTAKLRDGWYYSGDMGFILDGELFVTGRKDDMLIVNGRNYYAHEIEDAVNTVPGVLPGRNIAIGVDDEATDATVVIVIAECEPGGDSPLIRREIRRRVQDALGLTIHSTRLIHAGSLVKTTSGKISRVENRKRYLDGAFK